MDYRHWGRETILYISTTRGDHELQGWSRLRDFFRTYLCRSREGDSPMTRDTALVSGYWKDTFVFVGRSSLSLFLFRRRFSLRLCFFVPLYYPLDCSRIYANIDKRIFATLLFMILTLYIWRVLEFLYRKYISEQIINDPLLDKNFFRYALLFPSFHKKRVVSPRWNGTCFSL